MSRFVRGSPEFREASPPPLRSLPPLQRARRAGQHRPDEPVPPHTHLTPSPTAPPTPALPPTPAGPTPCLDPAPPLPVGALEQPLDRRGLSMVPHSERHAARWHGPPTSVLPRMSSASVRLSRTRGHSRAAVCFAITQSRFCCGTIKKRATTSSRLSMCGGQRLSTPLGSPLARLHRLCLVSHNRRNLRPAIRVPRRSRCAQDGTPVEVSPRAVASPFERGTLNDIPSSMRQACAVAGTLERLQRAQLRVRRPPDRLHLPLLLPLSPSPATLSPRVLLCCFQGL